MAEELLRATEVARRLGVTTRDVLDLIYRRKISYVMSNGIAHVPLSALAEYQAKAS